MICWHDTALLPFNKHDFLPQCLQPSGVHILGLLKIWLHQTPLGLHHLKDQQKAAAAAAALRWDNNEMLPAQLSWWQALLVTLHAQQWPQASSTTQEQGAHMWRGLLLCPVPRISSTMSLAVAGQGQCPGQNVKQQRNSSDFTVVGS